MQCSARLPTVKICALYRDFPGESLVKNLPANLVEAGSIHRLGRSPGVGNSNPLQYSCLENSMDRGNWHATVHGITELDRTEHAYRALV